MIDMELFRQNEIRSTDKKKRRRIYLHKCKPGVTICCLRISNRCSRVRLNVTGMEQGR
jgi:hypothetical protein